jgi:hypothetical protein
MIRSQTIQCIGEIGRTLGKYSPAIRDQMVESGFISHMDTWLAITLGSHKGIRQFVFHQALPLCPCSSSR